jgi:hypothetical protein
MLDPLGRGIMRASKIRRLAAAVVVAPIVAIGASAGVASAATSHPSSGAVVTAQHKAGCGWGWGGGGWGGGWGWGGGGWGGGWGWGGGGWGGGGWGW